jgi:hypothetical protein
MRRVLIRTFQMALVSAVVLAGITQAYALSYDERPVGQRVGYEAAAVAANIVPIASAVVEPKCLPGYILCKTSFAAMSVLGAYAQFFISGGSDMRQTSAILHKGFAGDWFVTGRHVAGDADPRVLPDLPARP